MEKPVRFLKSVQSTYNNEQTATSFNSRQYYHLFNRAVGNKKLIRAAENYRYFLSKMKQHILK
jgi:hypothetical protein